MTDLGDDVADVRLLIDGERWSAGDKPAIVGEMQRLCRAAVRVLPAAGVGVGLISEVGSHVTVAASSEAVERVEELQFSLGEGPCFEAYQSRRPVLVPHLPHVDRTRWPAYAQAAQDHGVRAVFAFPLQVGAARLGALDVYRNDSGNLSAKALKQALTFAEVATSTLLDAQVLPASRDDVLHDAVDNRYEVYQAQGMVMVQLQIGLVEALARIRAHAYAHHQRIGDVADDIVAGRLTFEPDSP